MKIKPSQTRTPASRVFRRQRQVARARAMRARRVSARRLLAPEQLQASLRLTPLVSLWMSCVAGLQSALAVLAAIVLVRYSLWPDLAGFAALGALAALFGRFAPLLKRHAIVWICAAMLVGAVFVTSLASLLGAPGYGVVLVVALVAGAASVGFSYWKLGGPGAVIIVFAAGAAMSPVESWQVFGERVAATAAGGVVAWLMTSATDFLRLKELSRIEPPQEASRPFWNILLSGSRIALGAAVAAMVAYAAGWNHPSWAPSWCSSSSLK